MSASLCECTVGPVDWQILPLVARRRLEVWFDGGSRGNPGVAGAGALMFSCNEIGKQLASAHWSFIGDSSNNNEAEYGGLLCGRPLVVPAFALSGAPSGWKGSDSAFEGEVCGVGSRLARVRRTRRALARDRRLLPRRADDQTDIRNPCRSV